MKHMAIAVMIVLAPVAAGAQNLGNYTANPYRQPATPNLFGNPQGNDSNSPKLYDNDGSFRGNLNANPYDPNSVANPNGRFGSAYSPESVNNPFGRGSPFRDDSPNNPYGTGLTIFGPRGPER